MPITMETQQEKVYVAVGKDVQEGMGTLKWALKNWSSQPISIVIVHVKTSSNDLVDTPYGKLPASSISDEGLEFCRMYGKDKTDKLLSKYKAFCGKVRTEVMKIETPEEPVHKIIVELISRLHVTKLVMGTTCMKSTSRKAKSGISGSFYVHKHKPDFCELFIICGGRLVSLQDASSEGCIEAEEEFTVDDMRKKMKEKGSLRCWIERLLPNYGTSSVASNSSRGSPHGQFSEDSQKWENCVEEIEKYLQWLSLNSPSEDIEEDGALQPSPMEQTEREDRNSNTTTPQKIEALKASIEDANKMTLVKRNEAKVSIERCRKAGWVISMCDKRVQELKAREDEEMDRQIDLKMELDLVRKQLEEEFEDVLENEKRLKSALELEGELKDIIQASLSDRLWSEAQLQNAAITREEILREINEMCRQRDVFRRRNRFCRERAVIMSNGLSYSYREFTEDELRKATDDFSDCMRIKVGPNGVIYKGRLNHTMIAIRIQDEWRRLSQEEFQAKVNLVRQIRHPHILTVLGTCSNPRSVVYEYAHNRSLQDILFSTRNPNPSKRSASSTTKNPRSRRKRPSLLLPWHDRIRIAAEICSAVAFLHATTPRPTAHGRIRPSNALIDRNLAAKIADFEGGGDAEEEMRRKDVCDLGVLMLQMVTGREDVEVERGGVLVGEADERAGEWPVEVAVRFGVVGARCLQGGGMAEVLREMEEVRRMAVAWRQHWCDGYGRDDEMDGSDVPAVFVCPILKEVMKQPYIAGDGFSYERDAIEAWLRSGHDTSPMTNVKLQHTRLTPNHTLRSLIDDWHYNRS